MKVELTNQAEARRVNKAREERSSWSLLTTESIVEAVHKARDLGWKDNKVQVRAEKIADDYTTYHVEPYEKGCGCRGLLRYKDFFQPEHD